MPETAKKSWLRHQHPEYSRNVDRWIFVRDAYTGDLLDPNRITRYLIKKTQSESPEGYKERCDLADFTPHFATLVDELAGMIFAVESEANRVFQDEKGNGLGDPADLNTAIGRLYQDADGRGNGWMTVWKQLASELMHSSKAWVVADATSTSPLVRIFPAAAVPNWRYRDGILVEVVVKEEVDIRQAIESDPKTEERYVVYTPEGWKRYRITTDAQGNESEQLIKQQGYDRGFLAPDGSPAVPIFPVELPIRRFVGWLMAKKAVAIFNKESERDNLLRAANFPFLVLPGSDTYYENMKEEIKKGSRLLQGDPASPSMPHFIAPSSEPAAIATDVLKRKVEEFYITGFREYGDAAREKTATEVRHEVASGVGAFLQMLKAALDDAENGALWRIEQIEYDDLAKWFICRVERSEEFVIQDPQMLAKTLVDRYLGKDAAVPVGRKGILSLIAQLTGYDGVTPDEGELEAAVRLHELKQHLNALSSLPIPAEGRAEMAVRLMAGLGFFDPKETIEQKDGSKKLKAELIREQALVLAEAQDQRERDFLGGMGAFQGTEG